MDKNRFILVFLLCFVFFTCPAEALSISAEGSWSLTIDANNLISGAGSDLKSDYESASDAVSIDILGANDEDSWQVEVRKDDIQWHDKLALYIQRTSAGGGSGTIQEGESYQKITEINQPFFEGSGAKRGITARLKLSGMSLQIPPGTYATTIYYTIVGS